MIMRMSAEEYRCYLVEVNAVQWKNFMLCIFINVLIVMEMSSSCAINLIIELEINGSTYKNNCYLNLHHM